MPHVQSGVVQIYWRSDGDVSLPPLVLANSLGTDFSLWDPVLTRLMRHFRVVRYDMRGHGASDAPVGDYTFDELTDDLEAVAKAAGLDRFHFCGVLMGGMVGMSYAARPGNRLDKIVLSNTAIAFDPGVWDARIGAVQSGGMAKITDAVLGSFYTPGFVANNGIELQRVRNTLLSLSPQGYAGCCAAIRDMTLADGLSRITAPALVLTGERDASTPPVRGEAIAKKITGAQISMLSCAHLPITEIPCQWTDAVLAFLDPTPAFDETTRFAFGLERRKQVLGTAYVEERLVAITPFTARFQNLITRIAWGEVWTSSRFEDVTRRLMVLSMMVALGKWEEFEMHIKAALRAGIEPPAIEETLVQAAIYCGVPAANTAFALAAKAVAEHKAIRPPAR